MAAARLSPLDASFLEVESPTAHMHVGWAAAFSPPEDGPAPSFERLRDHIASRLCLAPRYRQRLAPVPLGLNDPVWIDDSRFDVSRHVLRAPHPELTDVVDMVMSTQLPRDRPLWEVWIADRLADGRLGVVGKVHHCMVDGLAAVELGALLLDPTPEAPPRDRRTEGWRPAPAPRRLGLLTDGLLDRVREELDLVRVPARIARSPKRLFDYAEQAQRAARALQHSFSPATPVAPFNEPISPYRHLATARRPLDDLVRIKRRFGTTVNDVVLAASAGAARRFLEQRGQRPIKLKTMVPVSVREPDAGQELGNRIAFIFVDLPCDEPDPVRRLRDIHLATSERKDAGESHGAEAVLQMVSHAPHRLQRALSRLVASPRTFNLVVSNIPGPTQRLYMLGCGLEEAYPVVPLADRHAASIGFTTIEDRAFFGVYADRKSLPDADLLAEDVDESVEELLELSGARETAGARSRS